MIHEMPAATLVAKLKSGDLTSVEIVRALHDRADEVEPKVNAFAHRFKQQALREAKAADDARDNGDTRELLGLPVTIKENIETAGVASTLGIQAWSGRIAREDAVTVACLRRAGAIVLGKTNVPQTLMAAMETTNELFGTTHNPWRLSHGPGGSSGGEAAAIASGSSPLGIGTDIGGSIRTPASFCGITGIKPGIDRLSMRGSKGVLAGQEFIRAQMGPMARTVDDLILCMKALDPRMMSDFDSRVAPIAFQDPSEIDITKLRIGFYEDDGFFKPADSVRRAVREAVKALSDLGCEVVPFTPPNVEEIVYLYFQGVTSDGIATVDRALDGEALIEPLKTVGRIANMPNGARRGLARALSLVSEKRASGLLDALGEKTVTRYWEICARRNALRQAERDHWVEKGIDAVVCPMYVTPAAPIGMSHDFTMGFVNAARYNFLNLPAGSVPVTTVQPNEITRTQPEDRLEKRAQQIESASVGLPVGVQVVGRDWRESELLAVMKGLEGAVNQNANFPKTPVDPKY